VIAPHPEGVTLAVRAQPNAKRDAILGVHGGALKVAVSVPPEDGRANEAVVEVLKAWLGVKRSAVELLSGRTSRNKVFLLRGLTAEAVAAKVAAIPAPAGGRGKPPT